MNSRLHHSLTIFLFLSAFFISNFSSASPILTTPDNSRISYIPSNSTISYTPNNSDFSGTLSSGDNSIYKNAYAVLVAGSKDYENYRHQTNLCHTYQLVRKYGIPEERIIVMMYDDIATDPQNPFPGKLFNRPSSKYDPDVDVYQGVKKDYVDKDVTPQNFLNVITGNAEAMQGIGSSRVLNSTHADHVFIFFSDHGGDGGICFPNDEMLMANQLNDAILKMHSQRMYRRLVFYIEACESGSMFEGLLPKNVGVYAVTASSPTQLHYATYCPPEDDVVNGMHMGVCLSGEFSSSFLQNADHAGPFEALEKQYEYTIENVKHSKPQQYGDLNWTSDALGEYEGNLHRHSTIIPENKINDNNNNDNDDNNDKEMKKYSEYDAKLVSMFYNYLRSLDESLASHEKNNHYNYNSIEYLTRIRNELDDHIKIENAIKNLRATIERDFEISAARMIFYNIEESEVLTMCKLPREDELDEFYHSFNYFFQVCANRNVYSLKYLGEFKFLAGKARCLVDPYYWQIHRSPYYKFNQIISKVCQI